MDELIAIKDRAWEKFCTLPGVHAVGIGKKVRGGVRTEETVLTVFVTQKLPLDELNAEAAVPPVFEGVRTDIVEKRIPRTMQAPSITPTPADIPGGKRFTFTATPDPPPVGFMIVVTTTAVDAAGKSKNYYRKVHSNGVLTLDTMVEHLSTFSAPIQSTSTHGPPPTLEVTAAAGFTISATCFVVNLDLKPYFDDYLRGGVSIHAGDSNEVGTLGCIATTAPTAQNPQGLAVGLTNAHVIRDPLYKWNTFIVHELDAKTIELREVTNYPVTANSVVFVAFLRGPHQLLGTAFYTTSDKESFEKIASGLILAINVGNISGISASLASSSPTNARITISNLGANDYFFCDSAGPPTPPPGRRLSATVEKLALRAYAVDFFGKVSNANHGIYVDINPGGAAGTFGVFYHPPRNAPYAQVAGEVSKAIMRLDPALLGAVTAGFADGRVTINNAEHVDVWIHGDIRVGQPHPYFGAPNPACCNFRIGRVLDAYLDLDVALVQLDAGMKYKHHVEGLNAVAGTQSPTLNLKVQKRGATSGITSGIVTVTNASGFILGKFGAGTFTRLYRNVAVIESTVQEPGGKTLRPFLLEGDSGSAVVTDGTTPHKLVGVLFGGSDDTTGNVAPVDVILSRFSTHGLSFQPAAGVDINAVQTAPAAAADSRVMAGPAPFAAFGERMREAEQEIAATPVGREYAEVFRRNLPEALDLVNHNRRVATVWHRSGGPELLNAVLRALRFDDEPLPREINGRPLGDCIAQLKKILLRYASPDFAGDIARLAGRYDDFAGMTYRQMLATLRSGLPE